MKRLSGWIAVIASICFIYCGASCSSSDQKAEQAATTADGTLSDPAQAARTAARRFIVRPYSDSLQLHAQLLEVRAIQSRYVLAGNKKDAAIFDSIFISTLRTVNPRLCAEIEEGMTHTR